MSEEEESSESSASSPKPSEEILLLCARTGDTARLNELFSATENSKSTLDVNCKGTQKSNLGWTPLHLACYFGHKEMANALLKLGADVNVVNNAGDTPLHKAAYTGREEHVLLLLASNADVFIRNGEGQTAKNVAKEEDIKKLLKAAEDVDQRKKEDKLLNAAREGDITVIEKLLKEQQPLNINCTDSSGNTALHCVAYRGQKEAAVFLLQNGINSSIKNKRGQVAAELANSPWMKQILCVQPVKHLQKNATPFEGALLRKSRFIGWKPVWTVLERGVMSFFISRADATTGTRRKGYKYLDGGKVMLDGNDNASFMIRFSDNTSQRYSVPYVHYQQIDRQKWVNAITEHIEFSTHYLKYGLVDSDSDDELGDSIPLGTMQNVLQTAQAHQQLLERQVIGLKSTLQVLKNADNSGKNSPSLPDFSWHSLMQQLTSAVESSHKVASSLAHCMTLFSQQEEIRTLQLKQEQERCRVLQDALHVLAQEHHELECSINTTPFHSPPHSPLYVDTDCDQFFDAYEGDDDDSPTPVASAGNCTDDSTKTATESELYASFPSSTAASLSLHVAENEHSKWGRARLPVRMFSRNDFSVWSILRQCIGKELSKITMPVIFNEPLSFLQRISEYMEYSSLLEKANLCDDPLERMQLVSAFAVSALASNWERLGKPFNPLLGETYELVREDMGFSIVCEQVSHHPPISAFHAHSQHFIFYGSIHPKLKFWGKSVEIKPEGIVTLHLLRHNEVYTWHNVTCCVHNIIVGKLWFEQCGTMEITCHTNGLSSVLSFRPAGWFYRDLNCVEGFIYNNQKVKLRFLYGKWTTYLKHVEVEGYETYLQLKNKVQTSNIPSGSSNGTAKKSLSKQEEKSEKKIKDIHVTLTSGGSEAENAVVQHDSTISVHVENSILLWSVDPRPSYSSEYYQFTLFAMALNELLDGMDEILPQTDSRFRPDIRKLEEGDIDGAAEEKNRIEEKQREARKMSKKIKEAWQPKWFKLQQHPFLEKEEVWTYLGHYWDRNFTECPDIF